MDDVFTACIDCIGMPLNIDSIQVCAIVCLHSSCRELRKTMASLTKTIQQQKNDMARSKEKAEQAEQKLSKVRTV